MTVAANMAAVARLENPLRLSNFGGSGLDKTVSSFRKETTNTKVTTDAEKSTTNTPNTRLVDELHIVSSWTAHHRRRRKSLVVRHPTGIAYHFDRESRFQAASWMSRQF